MWAAIIMGVMAGISSYGAVKSARASAKMAESQATTNAKLAELNFNRRTQYRNEELGQQVWNISQEGHEMIGAQTAAMGGTGFDISTGDQRILNDTFRRNLEKISGVNRTYYLQQFEDEMQTENDILQYNFDAYSQRQIAKTYSGWQGAARVFMGAGSASLGSYQPSGKKGGISSNTGANSAFPSAWQNSASGQLQPYLNKSTDISGSLGSFSNFNGAMNF